MPLSMRVFDCWIEAVCTINGHVFPNACNIFDTSVDLTSRKQSLYFSKLVPILEKRMPFGGNIYSHHLRAIWLLASLFFAAVFTWLISNGTYPYNLVTLESFAVQQQNNHYYHDFDQDGYSERFRLSNRPNLSSHNILLQDFDTRVIDQANYSETITRGGLYFEDISGDNFDEMFALTWYADSLFLYIHDLQTKRAILKRQHIKLPEPDSIIERRVFTFHPITLFDVDGNGSMEFVFALFGNDKTTRSVYAWNYEQSGMIKSFSTHAAFQHISLVDLTGDGEEEIIIATGATGNIHTPVKYGDQQAWLFVLTSKLELLFPAKNYIEFPGGITASPLTIGDNRRILISESYSGVLNRENFLYLLDENGSVLHKSHSPIQHSPFIEPLVDNSVNPASVFALTRSRSLVKIDEELAIVNEYQTKSQYIWPMLLQDLNNDNIPELIVTTADELLIFNHNLRKVGAWKGRAELLSWSVRHSGPNTPAEVMFRDPDKGQQYRLKLEANPFAGTFLIFSILVILFGFLTWLFYRTYLRFSLRYHGYRSAFMQHDGAVGIFSPDYKIVRFNANFRNVFKTTEDFARFSDIRKSLRHLPVLVNQLSESVNNGNAISIELPPDKTIPFPGGKLIVRPWSAFRRWPLLYAMEFRPNEGSNQDAQTLLWTSFIAEQGHTVKNNIVALRNFTDAILTRLNDSPHETPLEVFDDLKNLKKNIGFTISTARKLVDFSQYQPPHYKPTDVRIALNETVEEYRRQFAGGPVLEYQLAENAVRAYTDIHHLKQTLRILLQNSARAAGDSGRIQLSVQQISNPSMPGDLWEAEIWDNGKGISQDVIDQVFDANYSTAPDGNGMGLAYVKMIVENNLGSIKVESKEEHFTRFVVRLPANHDSYLSIKESADGN